jgi:hypothetical protein
MVESGVEDLLLHPDDVDSVTRELALLRFRKEFSEFQRALREKPLLQ